LSLQRVWNNIYTNRTIYMLYPLPTSLNSWLVIAIGLLMFLGGAYHGVFFRDRLTSAGLVANGVGFLLLGLTEGFTDPTPRGKFLYRIAVIAFIVGIPIMLKTAYRMASSDW